MDKVMDDPTPAEQAAPEIRTHVQDSFNWQALTAHLGARLTHGGPGRVHIMLSAWPKVSQHLGYIHAGTISTIADNAGGYAAPAACHVEVRSVQGDGECTLVTTGQQILRTSIRGAYRPANGEAR